MSANLGVDFDNVRLEAIVFSPGEAANNGGDGETHYRIIHRVGRHLERTGLPMQDMESSYLMLQRATTRRWTTS